jgi:hypothetical protein
MWSYPGRTAPARTTARVSTAPGQWKYEIALGREAVTPGWPLEQPAQGGGGDARVGEVVVFRTQRPSQKAARVGTTPALDRRKVTRLWRSWRTAPARMTARRSTALGRWKCEIAPRRETVTPGRPLGRLAHDGGGGSRVGDVFLLRAHCPCPDDGPREHGARPVEVRDRPRARSGDAGPAARAAGARRWR